MKLLTGSEEETRRLGRRLGTSLKAPRTILLEGDLGAGKTALAKGLAEGLGVDPERVHSPTFTIVNEYPGGRSRIFHVDLYRLETRRDQDSAGLEEVLDSEGVIIVEWAERLAIETDPPLRIRIRAQEDDDRCLSIEGLRETESDALLSASCSAKETNRPKREDG